MGSQKGGRGCYGKIRGNRGKIYSPLQIFSPTNCFLARDSPIHVALFFCNWLKVGFAKIIRSRNRWRRRNKFGKSSSSFPRMNGLFLFRAQANSSFGGKRRKRNPLPPPILPRNPFPKCERWGRLIAESPLPFRRRKLNNPFSLGGFGVIPALAHSTA